MFQSKSWWRNYAIKCRKRSIDQRAGQSIFYVVLPNCFFLRDMTDLTHNKKVFSLKHIKTNLLLNEISIQPTYFTWLSDNDPTSINRLEGYDRFACANRVNTPGGGVGASSKNDFNFYRFLLAVELMNLIIKKVKWKEDIFFWKHSPAKN